MDSDTTESPADALHEAISGLRTAIRERRYEGAGKALDSLESALASPSPDEVACAQRLAKRDVRQRLAQELNKHTSPNSKPVTTDDAEVILYGEEVTGRFMPEKTVCFTMPSEKLFDTPRIVVLHFDGDNK